MMNIKYIKAIRELRIDLRRTSLAVFALALGIWGVGSVIVSYYILTRDLNENFQKTEPIHLILESNDFSNLDLKTFEKRPEVESAEFRDFSLQRIEIKPDEWIPLYFYGAENFGSFKLAKIFSESGETRPEKGSILLERDGQLISNLDVASTPRLRFGSKVINVPISGICFDPAQAPATQDHIMYAYTDKETYTKFTGLPVNRRLIIRFRNVYSAHDVQNTAAQIIKDLEENDIHITNNKIPLFNEHPHQWQLNTLLFLIGAIGLLAFIMGSVLVSQLMRSVMVSQIRQIGIMKSMGATQGKVFQIYTTMLLVIGLTAGIIAVPIAIATGNWFAHFVAGVLNFNILTSVPVSIYLLLMFASLVLPLLLSLSILIKSTKTSVIRALNDYGINVDNIGKKTTKKAVRFTNLPGTFILAVRNSLRNSRRLSITVITMALGVAIFSTGFNVRKSLWNLLSDLRNELRYDVQVALSKPISKEDAIQLFKGISGVKDIYLWNGGAGAVQTNVLSTNKGAGIIALPYNTELIKPKMIEGRWIRKSNESEVVMNQQAWQLYEFPKMGTNLNISIGDSIINVRIVGVAQQFELGKIFIDADKYDAMFNPQHLGNTISFVAENNEYENVIELKRKIERAIVPSNLNVLFVQANVERVKVVYDHLNIILSTILILSFLVLLVSAVGMASATGINISERTREIGIMRAIGATPKKIYSLFTAEGMIISMGSVLLGLLLAIPLSSVAAVFFGRLMLGDQAILQYAFSQTGFWITLIVTVSFGWIASRMPAKNAVTKISTREALTYE
ncbi:MAG: hypothetical protein A2W85_05245 [Bacteroidetes bacterium GWF2_41_31]|nr:MAG: hypothetical protein A2W85_05245 [Bacteroidetes bacterium GWF2_41_31]